MDCDVLAQCCRPVAKVQMETDITKSKSIYHMNYENLFVRHSLMNCSLEIRVHCGFVIVVIVSDSYLNCQRCKQKWWTRARELILARRLSSAQAHTRERAMQTITVLNNKNSNSIVCVTEYSFLFLCTTTLRSRFINSSFRAREKLNYCALCGNEKHWIHLTRHDRRMCRHSYAMHAQSIFWCMIANAMNKI